MQRCEEDGIFDLRFCNFQCFQNSLQMPRPRKGPRYVGFPEMGHYGNIARISSRGRLALGKDLDIVLL